MPGRSITYRFLADASGLRRETASAGRSVSALGANLERADKRNRSLGANARSHLRPLVGAIAAIGVGRIIKESVQLEAVYGRSMAQIRVATGATGRQMRELDGLAQKLGANTAFSASEAADAMVQLAKGGLSPAQIEAGALANTLTLATAGGLDLATAGNTVVQTMGAFHLSAKQTGAAVSALAGAANASSADVSDISQALSQAGTSAHAAGLSVQETTAILASFADSGIKGSDAGTSLRTMLTRLVPQTAAAKSEMNRLGLSFTKANGEFVSGTEIAGRLQEAYKGMSAAEKSKSLQTVFGSDAQRAANVLIGEGAKGVRDYLKQTSDLSQAQKLAKASMSGTAGAIERLSGATDTAKLQIGKGLAPTVQNLADMAGRLVSSGDIEGWARNAGQGLESFLHDATPLAKSLSDLGKSALPLVSDGLHATNGVLQATLPLVKGAVDAFNGLPDGFKQLVLGAGAVGYAAKRTGALNLGASLLGRGGLGGGIGGVTPVVVTNWPAGMAAGGLGAGGAAAGGAAAAGSASRLSRIGGALARGGQAAAILTVGNMIVNRQTSRGGGIAAGAATGALAGARVAGPVGAAVGAAGGGIYGALNHKDVNNAQWGFANAASPENAKNVKVMAAALGVLTKERDKLASGNPEQFKKMLDIPGPVRENADKMAVLENKLAAATGLTTAQVRKHSAELAKTGTATTSAADNLSYFAFKADQAGISADQLGSMLGSLPPTVATKILTPGAVESKADVTALARQFGLTPAQVKTIMTLVGSQKAQDDVKATRKGLRTLNQTSAKPRVDLDGGETVDKKVKGVDRGLRTLNQRSAKPKVDVPGAAGATTKVKGVDKSLKTLGGRTAKPKIVVGDNSQKVSSGANRNMKSVKDTHPKIDASTNAGAVAAAARGAFASVHDKTVYLRTVRTTTNNVVNRVSSIFGGGRAGGGLITGPGTKTSDDIPVRLSNGEYVIRAAAVDRYGPQLMERINTLRFAQGGLVANTHASTPRFASGGQVQAKPAGHRDDDDDRKTREGHKRREKDRESSHKRHMKRLEKVNNELDKMREKLQTARQDRREYKSTVSQAYVGNPFEGTLAGFDAQTRYETKRLRGTRADLATLRKRGLDGRLYKDLAASGNASLLDQFSRLSRKQIAARERSYGVRNRIDTQIGNMAANRVFNKQIHHLSGEVHDLSRELHALRHGKHIGNHTTKINRQVNHHDGKAKSKKASSRLRSK